MYSPAFFLLLIASVFGTSKNEAWNKYLDEQKDLKNIEHAVVLDRATAEIKAITYGSPISESEATAGAKSFDTDANELKQTGLFYGTVHYDVYEVKGDHIYGAGTGESLLQVRLDGFVLAVCCIGPMETCQPHAEQIADWLRDHPEGFERK